MALEECHDCGYEVSTDSRSCQKCGAKMKRPTSRSVKVLYWIIGILGLAMLKHWADQPIIRTPEPAKATVSSVQTPSSLGWKYLTKKDEMSSKDILSAAARSTNTVDLQWPYGPGIGADIVFCKHPRFGKSVFISIDKGQIRCSNFQLTGITVRFDDHPATKFLAYGPSDGSTEMVYIKDYAKFLAETKRSKKMLIELPLFQEGNRSWEFEVKNLSW